MDIEKIKKVTYVAAAIISLLAAGVFNADLSHEPKVELRPLTSPEGYFQPDPQGFVDVRENGFSVLYCKSVNNPVAVGYELREANRRPPTKRPSVQFEDAPKYTKVTTSDFTRSGYSRGHMAPSHAIGMFHGREAQIATFTVINICPQKDESNAGVWNSIERMEVNDFVKRFGVIRVYCGPLFGKSPPDYIDGPRSGSKIAIPTEFFKLITDEQGKTIKAYIVPQIPESPDPRHYETTREEIARRTSAFN